MSEAAAAAATEQEAVSGPRDEAYCLGIDEAGRGPVLGPMVYAASVCPVAQKDDLKHLEVDDSKVLTAERRGELRQVLTDSGFVTTELRTLHAHELSGKMLRRSRCNLNRISHEAAIELIQRFIDRGFNVREIFVDTVGPPSSYQAKLERHFPGIVIKVMAKADALFPIVSAASICAKVHRDHLLESWSFREAGEFTKSFGSGYPGDPTTKQWLRDNLDPVFGFPSLVRFSWSTSRKLLEERAHAVHFLAELSDDDGDGARDDDEGDKDGGSKGMSSRQSSLHSFFLANSRHSSARAASRIARQRHRFFHERRLQLVRSLY